jgi:hypothetical protein
MFKNLSLIILVSILKTVIVNGQTISGTVTDENQKVLPYVNIGVIGLNRGTISNSDGKYYVDISGIDSEKILRFSHVGFEHLDFKIRDLNEREDFTLNVVMNENIFQLQEVIIRTKKSEPIYIGSKRAGRNYWMYDEAINGFEIGTVFQNDKLITLDKFYFHVKRNYCDSIYYRLKIYDIKKDLPNKIINSKDIKFISKLKKGWESVNLYEYNLEVSTNFIITLEVLESWTSREYRITHLSSGWTNGLSYRRPSSMAPWLQFQPGMSYKIEVSHHY